MTGITEGEPWEPWTTKLCHVQHGTGHVERTYADKIIVYVFSGGGSEIKTTRYELKQEDIGPGRPWQPVTHEDYTKSMEMTQ